MKFNRFEDIIAWQKSKVLVLKIYKAFEDSKDFAFRDQIRRAAISIMNNIAEGFERNTDREFLHFLYTAKGSCSEVRSMLILAFEHRKISEQPYAELNVQSLEISKLLS